LGKLHEGQRPSLRHKEEKKLAILRSSLPTQLSEEELSKEIEEVFHISP